MLWTTDGVPLQAFLGCKGDDRRAEYIVTTSAKGGEKVRYFVEMVCTAMFGNGTGNGWGGLGPNPTDLDKTFKLSVAEIGCFDRLASQLLLEFTVIQDMAKVRWVVAEGPDVAGGLAEGGAGAVHGQQVICGSW